jgi:peptidylprolyl isomerase
MPTDKRLRQKQGRAERMAARRAAAKRAARRRRLVAGLVVAALVVGVLALLSQVGGDEDDEQAATTTTTTTTATTTTASAPPRCTPGQGAGAAGEKPTVTVPEQPAPTELQCSDLRVGDGAEAEAGATVQVNYVGVAYSTGREFDTSYGRQPFSFELGAGNVIRGWDEGVVGMKVGGQRQLVIPPALAYGERGQGEAIGPNETLIFVIDLLEVT